MTFATIRSDRTAALPVRATAAGMEQPSVGIEESRLPGRAAPAHAEMRAFAELADQAARLLPLVRDRHRSPLSPAAPGLGDRRFFVHCGMKHDVKL